MDTIMSSSSELLLDEQEEIRKRKIKELTLAKNNKVQTRPSGLGHHHHQDERNCREQALFYATSFLAILAIAAGSSLLFLVPLYVDPAISTLVNNFVDDPVQCVTTRMDQLTGLANCSWSSCREGCTSDAYHCTHIYVNYNYTTKTTPIKNEDEPNFRLREGGYLNNTEDAILLVNIKGCGYPPKIRCLNFTDQYGEEGTQFPCYPSRQNGTVVLTHFVRDEQIAIIIHYFAIPFVVTLATSVALCVMHCDCTCTPNKRRRSVMLMRSSSSSRRRPPSAKLIPLRSDYSDGSLISISLQQPAVYS